MTPRHAAVAAALCAAILVLSGCGTSGPDEGPGTVPQEQSGKGPDPALGGVQPDSTAPAGELMDSAVERTDALMSGLGGEWTFQDGVDAYDAAQIRDLTPPEPCTTRSGDGETASGGMYSVVAVTGLPDEDTGQTLERFEEALESSGYTALDGNGVGPDDRVVANGESEQGRVTLTRSAEDVQIQVRTACSMDPSLETAGP